MPSRSVQTILVGFGNEKDRSIALVNRVRRLSPHMSTTQVQMIAELSFLRMFVAWEFFLENTFYAYMCGKQSLRRWRPTRYVTPKNSPHASKMCRMNRQYVDWSNHRMVVDRARIFFKDGEPFATCLGNVGNHLIRSRKMRNRIAHKSTKSDKEFKAVMQEALGYVPSRTRPGKFLLMIEPQSGTRFLDFYANMFDDSSQSIAKFRP